jgi:hypothetical protein
VITHHFISRQADSLFPVRGPRKQSASSRSFFARQAWKAVKLEWILAGPELGKILKLRGRADLHRDLEQAAA